MRTELHYFLWIKKVFFCFLILYTCFMKRKFIYQEDNLRGMCKCCKELRCAFNCLEWHKELSHWPFFPFFQGKKRKKNQPMATWANLYILYLYWQEEVKNSERAVQLMGASLLQLCSGLFLTFSCGLYVYRLFDNTYTSNEPALYWWLSSFIIILIFPISPC